MVTEQLEALEGGRLDPRKRRLGRRPVRIGLTGQLASGKSTCLKVFSKLGWKTASADLMVHEIYRKKGLSKSQILRRFGTTPAGLRRLEKWIHPFVKRQIIKLIRQSRRPLVVEVPLLFEAKLDRLFDRSIFIFAPLQDRQRRAVKRGMSLQLFKALEKKQWPALKKAQAADFILHNRSKKELKKQAKLLSRFLRSL